MNRPRKTLDDLTIGAIYVYGLTDESLDNWDPNAITWANAPGNDPASAYKADTTETTLLGTFLLDYNGDKASPVGTVISFSNQSLISFLNSDTNGQVTFILGRTGRNSQKNLLFASDTHSTLAPPTLALVPEPSAIALLGLGGLAILRRRRRS